MATPPAGLESLAALNGGKGPTPAEAQYLQSLHNAEQGPAGTPATSTANAVGQDTYSYVLTNFPSLAWMLQVPELGQLIANIANGTVKGDNGNPITDANQIAALVENTAWWKTQSADVRNWYQLEITDPATAQEQVQAAAQNVQASADQLGVRLSQAQITGLAYADQMNGWSTQELANHISQGISPNQDGSFSYRPYYIDPGTGKAVDTATGRQAYEGPNGEPATPDEKAAIATWGQGGYQTGTFQGQTVYYKAGQTNPLPAGAAAGGLGAGTTATTEPGGTLQSTEQQLQALAKQYLVSVDPNTLATWSAQIAANQQSLEGFQSFLTQQALNKFGNDPGMTQALKSGQSSSQYLTPYSSMLQSELGIDSSGIDWTQPKYAKLLTETDPASGTVVSTPLWKATQIVRTDPAFNWSASPNGVSAQYNFVQGLQQALGFRNYGGDNVSAPAAMSNTGG